MTTHVYPPNGALGPVSLKHSTARDVANHFGHTLEVHSPACLVSVKDHSGRTLLDRVEWRKVWEFWKANIS